MLPPLFDKFSIIRSDLFTDKWFFLGANVNKHHLGDLYILSLWYLILLLLTPKHVKENLVPILETMLWVDQTVQGLNPLIQIPKGF